MIANRISYCLKSFVLLIGFAVPGSSVLAQENPPIPIKVEVRTAKFLDFGTFASGATGGTITVDHSEQRYSTGDIFELHIGKSPSAALFDLIANPGTIINILVPSRIDLNLEGGGTLGSGFVQLELNSFSTGEVFITTAVPPIPNEIYVGGTLHIGSGAPAGNYSGSFTLTFNHE